MATFSNTPRPAYVYEAATDQWIPVGFGPHTHAVTDVTNAFNTTTVTTKGDLVVAAGSNNITRLPAGSNGQSLVADSTTTTGLRWQDTYTSGKNLVINGGMDIWQRGTTFTTDAAATVLYTADRISAWTLFPGNDARQTITRETTHVPPNFKYSLKSVVSNAIPVNAGRMLIGYTMENQDALAIAGKTITYSMQVKAIGNIDRVYLYSRYNTTGGNVHNNGTDAANAPFTINSSSFTTITWTTTVPSAATLTSSGTYGLMLVYYRANNAVEAIGDGVYVTGIQAEIGSVATPFSRAGGTLQGELAACQRYYYRLTSTGYNRFAIAQCITSNTAQSVFALPLQFRAAPTALEQTGTASNYALTSSSGSPLTCSAVPSFDISNSNYVSILFTVSSGLTAGHATQAISNAVSAYLGVSAEL
jgi:hypothetical protein